MDLGYYLSLYLISDIPLKKILVYLLKEIEELYFKRTIIVILKPLYGVTEAGTY